VSILTTEEKLQHFLETCMEDARIRSEHMLDEYTEALEKTVSEHQAEAIRRADMQLTHESDKIKREINKQLATQQIAIKRTLGQKQEELKDKLFAELRDMLANYLESHDYFDLLDRQIARAVTFAGKDDVTVYLDPVDEDKIRRLALRHGRAHLVLSEYSFAGGTRAVIPARHILIDNSFETRLAEQKENFHFDLSLTEGGNSNG